MSEQTLSKLYPQLRRREHELLDELEVEIARLESGDLGALDRLIEIMRDFDAIADELGTR